MQTCSFEQFVGGLCDSGLIRAREIQSFFDGLPEHHAESTAEELAAEMVRRGMLTPFQAEALLQGKARALTLGSYAILDRLGQGGMGQVYRGFHKKMNSRFAAFIERSSRCRTKSPIRGAAGCIRGRTSAP